MCLLSIVYNLLEFQRGPAVSSLYSNIIYIFLRIVMLDVCAVVEQQK